MNQPDNPHPTINPHLCPSPTVSPSPSFCRRRNSVVKALSLPYACVLLAGVALVGSPSLSRARAQLAEHYLAPPTYNQRQVLNQLRTQLEMFEHAVRHAPSFNTRPDAMLWTHFDGLRVSFEILKQSLSPVQLQRGANDLADLDAGLAIIAEAFPNFQEDLDRGRSGQIALRTLCQVLRDSMRLWGQQLNTVSRRLQIGR